MALLAISTNDRKTGKELAREYRQKIGNASISIIENDGDIFTRPLIGCVKDR